MSEITRVVAAAGRRLFFMRFVAALAVAATAALSIAGVARILDKTLVYQPNWLILSFALAGLALAVAAVYAAMGSPPRVTVAQQVDDGAGLRDSLSTAMAMSSSSDAWARNVIDGAARAAAGVNIKQALPWQTPRHAWSPLIAGLCVLVLWFMPVPDVFGKRTVIAKQLDDEKKIEEAQAQAKAAESKVLEPLKKIAPDLLKGDVKEDDKVETPKPKTADDFRRNSIKKLTNISQKIEQMMGGADAQKTQITQDMLRQLRSPVNGPISGMSKELAKGNFTAAQQELQKALESLASGTMSEADKQTMKEQLKNVAEQMKQLAETKKELENKLAQAGMDPKLAGDPAKLAEAMAKNDGMSQQQKDAMVNAAQAQQAAGENMAAMAQAMQQMAQGMGQQGMDQQGSQAAQQAMNQMQQMEGMMQDAKGMQAAMAEAKFQLAQMGEKTGGQCDNMGDCEGGLSAGNKSGQNPGQGNGQFKMGDTSGKGGGQGGPGQGDGGGRGEEPAEEKWQQRKAKTQLGQGPIIASTFIEGDSIKNDAKAQFGELVEAATKDAQDAIESKGIEKPFQKQFKFFIGSMQGTKGDASKTGAVNPGAKPAVPEKK